MQLEVGTRINRLMVVERLTGRKYLCRCDCGAMRELPLCRLIDEKHHRRSCGKCPSFGASKISTGDKFHWLTVERRVKRDQFECLCECGNRITLFASRLLSGQTKSCGCTWLPRTKEGALHRTREYNIWGGMIQRCHNPNRSCFADYGGRGITVCDKWRNSYDAFLADVGRCPSPKHSLERENNELGYLPGNVVWATPKQQQRNKRSSRHLEFGGYRMILNDWATVTGLSPNTIRSRIDRAGWSVEDALTLPKLRSQHDPARYLPAPQIDARAVVALAKQVMEGAVS